MISTSSNKHIKELALLMRKSGARREKGLYVAEGLKIFSELPSSAIERLYVSERFYQGMSPQIGEKLQEQEYYLVSDRVFEGLSDTKTPPGGTGSLQADPFFRRGNFVDAKVFLFGFGNLAGSR